MQCPPLGRVLVEMGAIDAEQLDQILALQRHNQRRLGEIVVDRGLISPLALAVALARQKSQARATQVPALEMSPTWKPLGLLLIERRCISQVQLQQALVEQRENGRFLGEILLDRGWITSAELVRALNDQLSPTDGRSNTFVVREHNSGEIRELHEAPTFMDACDYAFDQVLDKREPEGLEIVRGNGAAEEVVWAFKNTARRKTSAAELLKAFSFFTDGWAAVSATPDFRT